MAKLASLLSSTNQIVNPNGEYTDIKIREKTNVKSRKYMLYNIL